MTASGDLPIFSCFQVRIRTWSNRILLFFGPSNKGQKATKPVGVRQSDPASRCGKGGCENRQTPALPSSTQSPRYTHVARGWHRATPSADALACSRQRCHRGEKHPRPRQGKVCEWSAQGDARGACRQQSWRACTPRVWCQRHDHAEQGSRKFPRHTTAERSESRVNPQQIWQPPSCFTDRTRGKMTKLAKNRLLYHPDLDTESGCCN